MAQSISGITGYRDEMVTDNVSLGGEGTTNGFKWLGSDIFAGYNNDIETIRFDADNNVSIPNGNLVIGTASPLGKLHVHSGVSGVSVFSGGADDLIIENTTDSGLTIATSNTGTSNLYYADPQSPAAGFLQYNHQFNYFRIGVSNTERFLINSSGNAGFSESSPDARIHAFDAVSTLAILQSTSTNSNIAFADAATTSNSHVRIGSFGNAFRIITNNVERVRINSLGFFGVGTSSPNYIFEVAGNDEAVVAGKRKNNTNGSLRILSLGSTNVTNAEILLGSGTDNSIRLRTGTPGSVADAITIDSTGTSTFNNDAIVIEDSKTPSSATATGTKGEIAYDNDFVYVCVNTDTWKRVAIATW